MDPIGVSLGFGDIPAMGLVVIFGGKQRRTGADDEAFPRSIGARAGQSKYFSGFVSDRKRQIRPVAAAAIAASGR
jgi:hypothetical protein